MKISFSLVCRTCRVKSTNIQYNTLQFDQYLSLAIILKFLWFLAKNLKKILKFEKKNTFQ